MKQCKVCNDFALYEDNESNCPICGNTLTTYVRADRNTRRPVYQSNLDNNIEERGNTPSGTTSGGAANTDTRGTTPRRRQPISPNNGNGGNERNINNGSVNNGSTNNGASGTRGGRTPVQPPTNNRVVPEFETRSGLGYTYHGTVAEVQDQSRYHNRFKKIVNAIFLGEPYQFGNTSHFTAIRVEAFHEGRLIGEQRDLLFYGDVGARIFLGDEVEAYATRQGSRMVVRRLHNIQTNSNVRPAPQIPAILIRILALVALVATIALIVGMVNFVASGMFLNLLRALAEYVIVFIIVIAIIRGIFRRR